MIYGTKVQTEENVCFGSSWFMRKLHKTVYWSGKISVYFNPLKFFNIVYLFSISPICMSKNLLYYWKMKIGGFLQVHA